MATETSLARQLKALAVPQTSLFLFDKIKPSLLYHPKDAASYDRDHFYACGATGLDKLVLIEPKFIIFEQSLFSESSKTLERSVQTSEINKKLNQTITRFLSLLSPYFLLRAAHEALEWLIYRFHIHLYNVDELIACILPHHYTRMFVRVIQILDLSDPAGRWHWMKPMQASRTPLETSMIVNRFNVDGSFRSFVCDLIPSIMQVYNGEKENVVQSIISFSTLTVYNALQSSTKVNDNLFALLLPFILRGLKSKMSSYCAGTYMIICSLITKVKLTLATIEDLLLVILKNFIPGLQRQGLETMLLVFQYQDIHIIPKSVFASLYLDTSVVDDLGHISEKCRCGRFKHCLLKKAIPLAFKREVFRKSATRGKVMHFTEAVLKCLSFEKSDVLLSLKLILNNYAKMHIKYRGEEKILKTLKKVGSSLLKCLEIWWANYFDCALENFFRNNLKKKSKIVRDFVNYSVTSFKHEMVPFSTVTLFIGINHHIDVVREGAVDVFLDRIKKNQCSDVEFAKTSLVARLNDNCPEIVLKILSAEEVLLDFFLDEELLDMLSIVIKKNHEGNVEKWDCVKEEALKLLCAVYKPCTENVLQWKLFSVILPYLLPWANENLRFVKCVLNSQLVDKHSIVHALREACLLDLLRIKEGNHEMFLKVAFKIVKTLLLSLESMKKEDVSKMVHYLIDHKPNLNEGCTYNFILILILQHAIILESDVEQRLYWTQEVIKLCSFFLSSSQQYVECKVPQDLKETVFASAKTLKKMFFPLSAILYVIQSIIKVSKMECNLKEKEWWPDFLQKTNQSFSYKITVEIFEFLIDCINKPKGMPLSGFKNILNTMFKNHFGSLQEVFWFLSSLWSNYYKVNSSLQITALKVAESLCVSSDASLSWIYDKSSVEIPSLIVAVASQNEQIRSSALHLFKGILESTKKCVHPLRSLVEEIFNHQEEIIMDSSQLYQVIDNWLIPAYLQGSSENHQVAVYKWLKDLILDSKTPIRITHCALLSLKFVDSEEILKTFLPIAKVFLNRYKECMLPHSVLELAIIELLLNKFTVKTASLLVDEKGEAFEVLSMALQLTIQRNNILDVTVHEMALKRVTKDFFIRIPSTAVQQKLLGIVVDLYLNAGSSNMIFNIGRTLKKLCVYASLLLKELRSFEFSSSEKTVSEMKRSRTEILSAPSETDMLENFSWKKIIIILEIIQDKKKIDQKTTLIPELFSILNKTLEWDNQPSVEYVRQLVLSSIFNCCNQMDEIALDERKFQVELIIQCIRISDNPRTHHHALLLLNLAAAIFPDYVLNNLMSIFTFMGSSVVRHDDSYSFQVISQTIETIVPALLQASHQQKEDESVQVISSVIRVFIGALLDIPRHRQQPLFTKLITTLGPSDYLWLPLAQVCEYFVLNQISPAEFAKTVQDLDNNPYFEFIFNLYQQFTPATQINACTRLIKFLVTLPDFKDDVILGETHMPTASEITCKEPFDPSMHTNFHLQSYKFVALSALNYLLSSQVFVEQISELDSVSLNSMDVHYEELLEITLQYLQHMSQAPQVKRGQSLLLKIYELLNNVNSLLPCMLFIAVTRKLLSNPTSLVRRKTIEMLNSKLEHQSVFFLEGNYKSLLKLLQPLLRIVKKNENNAEGVRSDDFLYNRQSALISLHLLCKIVGKEYPQKFYKVLHVVVEILETDSSQCVLAISALVCLAQLCSILQEDVVPRVNSIMPHVVHILENFSELRRNEGLAMGAVTAIQGLVEHLGLFLSRYVQPIVKQVCLLNSAYSKSNGCKANLQRKLRKVCELISSKIPPRVLVPAVYQSYLQLLEEDENAISGLMSILGDRLSTIELLDVQAHSSEIQELFLCALDFRYSHPEDCCLVLEAVEESIIFSLVKYVMKLSESGFRSFFHSIYLWATKSLGKHDRVLTFYRLTNELSGKLKDLFVLFAGHFYRNAAVMLDANNVTKSDISFFGNDFHSATKSSHLLNNILDTLSNCFINDRCGFVDKNCFNILMQPLVDQIENKIGGEDTFQERIDNHLKQCIALLAVSVSDNTLWKNLNHQVLLKTRNSSSNVRFAALKVIGEIVKTMASDYLVLLPESIPFLSELMEDENPEVERECQTITANMEKVLGEPIKKYF